MGNFLQDLKYGIRMLAKNPGFATVAVLTLALGIGANTAIFTVVNSVLLRPLAFRDPSRVVLVVERSKFPTITTSYENYLDWRDQSRSFESMEATMFTNLTLTGIGDPERIPARRATAGLFPLLGVKPFAGRSFLPEEDRAGGAPVVMVSYRLWQRRFAGSTDWIGKTITLDSQPYTLIGVLPPDFQLLQPADLFVPFHPWAKTLPDDRNWHPGIIPVARLKADATLEQARAEMKTIAQRLEKQYPDYNTGYSADVVHLQDQIVQNVRPALLVLLGAVGFILLIACANVANLLLARAASRAREIAIRTALGASRMRVVRQLLTESIVIAVVGGGLGLVFANAALGPLLKLSAGTVPNAGAIEIDRWVLVFTAAASLLTGILFGLIPALRTAQLDLCETLNEGGRGSTGGAGSHRLRSALVVTEIAVAMLLLVGAGLFLRSFERMQAVPPGFTPDHLLAADIPLSPAAYQKPEMKFQFFDRLLERTRTLPGVRSAGAASFLPMSGGGSIIHFNINGRPPKSPHEFIAAGYRTVTPNYLETLGVPLVAGRMITDADSEISPAVVLINSSMAREFFPGESPLGKRMQLGEMPDQSVPWMEIVGVVGDVRPGLGTDPQAEMYLPYRQADGVLPVFQLSVVLRTTFDPASETSALRSALAEIDKNQPLVNVRTMEDNMAASVAQPRFRAWLLGLFALLALLLSTIGIYGVMSYTVNQRTHEIGIRITLGAQPFQVFRLVTGQGLRLALLGVAIGLAASLALTRVLRSFLYNVSAIDPVTYLVVAGILVAVGLLASYLPARRATRVDPLIAIRYE
ncbi:MAG: ABC transporter permease [Candidatus Acidiferrales bacterium]